MNNETKALLEKLRSSKAFWISSIFVLIVILSTTTSGNTAKHHKRPQPTTTTIKISSDPIHETFSISLTTQRAISSAIANPDRNTFGYTSVADFLWQNACFNDSGTNPFSPAGATSASANFRLDAVGKRAKSLWKQLSKPWNTCTGKTFAAILVSNNSDSVVAGELEYCCIATTTTTTIPPAQRFINNSQSVSITSLANNSWQYLGSKIKIQCLISSPIKDDYGFWSGFNCFSADYSEVIYADLSEVYVDTGSLNQDQWVTIWGKGGPQFTGTNAFGGTVQHSSIVVKYLQTGSYRSW